MMHFDFIIYLFIIFKLSFFYLLKTFCYEEISTGKKGSCKYAAEVMDFTVSTSSASSSTLQDGVSEVFWSPLLELFCDYIHILKDQSKFIWRNYLNRMTSDCDFTIFFWIIIIIQFKLPRIFFLWNWSLSFCLHREIV